MYRLQIHPFAELELKEAQNWYNLQKENLGDDFIHEIENKLNQITHNPHRFRKIRKDVRVAFLKRFPYSVIFTISENSVQVYAFFHHSRNPKVWNKRSK
ncbi:type II toxin-antitoxin system RelE/ParE family toxin [Maribellus sediminis]|uniref:type II toxin-antitoxin system RelE/ParE family toxin n=1 Tax=Maribellus sediminis TaxID=2696285 RepID=UPI001431C6F5